MLSTWLYISEWMRQVNNWRSPTRLGYVGSTFIPDMIFVCEPLHAFPKGVHIRILEDVYHHYDLIVPNGGAQRLTVGAI